MTELLAIDTATTLSQQLTQAIRRVYQKPEGFLGLHEPQFNGNEKAYLLDCIDSTFVSSVGAYVNRFEAMMAEITGAQHAIAICNGTAALHLAMVVAGVQPGDLVITQPLTFIATANAISHAGAEPVFVDVDRDTLSLSPDALQTFLEAECELLAEGCRQKATGRRIAAVVPMHSFGFLGRIQEISRICQQWKIALVEDAAESLGSYLGHAHSGTEGLLGCFSFNGNKTVTCGGGGAIVTNDDALGKLAKHLSTTAKQPHKWAFNHDAVAWNYRMPNLNAALACAQLEQLPEVLANKAETAAAYQEAFAGLQGVRMVPPLPGTKPNNWLNTLLFDEPQMLQNFLEHSNAHGVMTRPSWGLMHHQPMYAQCLRGPVENSEFLAERLVNIPSSIRNVA